MGFLSVVHSDRGIKKNTNQDSVLIKEASTDYGDVMLAVVCDGMGGLAKGEVASAALIKAFSLKVVPFSSISISSSKTSFIANTSISSSVSGTSLSEKDG